MIATLSLLKACKTTLSIVLDNTKNIQKLLNPQNAGGWRGGGRESKSPFLWNQLSDWPQTRL